MHLSASLGDSAPPKGSAPADRSPETARVGSPDHVSWYALRVRTRSEFTAMQLVCSRGFQAFAPVHHYTVRPGGKGQRTLRQTALFPGYLFARLSDVADLFKRPVPMVFGVIGVDGEPAPISEQDIAYLQVVSGRSDRVQRMARDMAGRQVISAVLAKVQAS